MPGAFSRYTPEEWHTLLVGVLPVSQVSDIMKNNSMGITVNIKMTFGIPEEYYEKYRLEYIEKKVEDPALFEGLRYIRDGMLDENGMPIKTYLSNIELSVAIPFVLELPFQSLPLYTNCAHEQVQKLVKARIRIGK